MKKSCLPLFAFLLFNTLANTQAILQIGVPFTSDEGYDLLLAQDGGFVTCGYKGNNAVVYKSDCTGNLTAQIEKAYAPGPARFYDAVQMPDGSIVAVGSATIAAPADTFEQVILLKTSADLTELIAAHYPVAGKAARAKSIARASNGNLLVFGEVAGNLPNLSDMFLLRVDQTSLQPVFNPAVYNFINGVDIATEIIRTADGNCLLAGSSFLGDISNPNAMIVSRLTLMKTTEGGPLLWTYAYVDTFPAQYGPALAGGVEQNPVTGNIMFSGATYGDSPEMHQDAIFILLDNNGGFLDTAFLQTPLRQGISGMTGYAEVPGLFLAVGESDNPVFGVPNLFFAQAYELNGQIFQTAFTNEMASPLSLSDVIEIGQNRLAIIATIPDNPALLTSKDILVATPQIEDIEILYQNCALVASFSAVDPSYQWYRDEMPVPGATGGVYFPDQSGVYRVQITDSIGCSGFSDTLTVLLASAGFDVETDNLTATFTNNSTGAASWLWDFGDGQTSDQANPVHDYAAGGTYVVTLIASNPCSADTITQTIGLVGAGEPSAIGQCRLYPNPNEGVFSVTITGMPQPDLALTLLDQTGQVVGRRVFDFSTGTLQYTFDCRAFPAGVYILQLQTGGETRYLKVMLTQ